MRLFLYLNEYLLLMQLGTENTQKALRIKLAYKDISALYL